MDMGGVQRGFVRAKGPGGSHLTMDRLLASLAVNVGGESECGSDGCRRWRWPRSGLEVDSVLIALSTELHVHVRVARIYKYRDVTVVQQRLVLSRICLSVKCTCTSTSTGYL